jgi:hypothetical protein
VVINKGYSILSISKEIANMVCPVCNKGNKKTKQFVEIEGVLEATG